MKTKITTQFLLFFLLSVCLTFASKAQVLFYEGFDMPSTWPTGWTRANVDNRTPASGVSYITTNAWMVREDFQYNVLDSFAISTSWYNPVGAADDWMWTPPVLLTGSNLQLSWKARSFDAVYPDGYEVRIMTTAPTGSTGNMGNMLSSTLLFNIAAENSGTGMTSRFVNLNSYVGQTVYIGFRNNSNDMFVLALDDIKIEAVLDFDASLNSINFNTEYTQIPVNQASSIALGGGTIQNIGADTINNVNLAAVVRNASNSIVANAQGTAIPLLLPGASQAYSLSPSWTPAATGSYQVSYYPTLTQTDQRSSNDTIHKNILISDSVYARDNGQVTAELGIGSNGVLGHVFNINTYTNVSSLTVRYNSRVVGEKYALGVWAIDTAGNPTSMVCGTDTLFHTGTDSLQTTMPIQGGAVLLSPGRYLVAVIEFIEIIKLAQTPASQTNNPSWAYVNGGWMNLYNNPITNGKVFFLRMNVQECCTGPLQSLAANALSMDGINDRVEIPDANELDLVSSYTLECWIKPEGFSALGGIISKYHTPGSNGFTLRLNNTAPYTGLNFDEMETPGGVLQAGRWYHIAAVYNGSSRKLFVNGIEQPLTGTPIPVAANNNLLAIGADYLAAPRCFKGVIDEVRIWNIARTVDEIFAGMNTEISNTTSGLVAYYKMNSGIAGANNAGVTAVNDITTVNNQGTAVGFTLNGKTSNWVSSLATLYATDINNVLFVRKGSVGIQNGNNWENAISELADALRWAQQNESRNLWSAANPLKIWVAGGTYKPIYNPANGQNNYQGGRDNAFKLMNNVYIYGNFAGWENSLVQRNKSLSGNSSVLTGDLDNSANDAYHVVVAAGGIANSLLDGFTITGANADDGSHTITMGTQLMYGNMGGGVLINFANPKLNNLIISGNRASFGAGMLIQNNVTSPIITNTVISGNKASSSGGGIYNDDNTTAKLVNVTISGNNATGGGGGMVLDNASPSLYNCIVWGNSTAIGTAGTVSPLYSRCLIAGGAPGTGNLNTDPLFINAPSHTTAPFNGGNYSLQLNSPAINSGDTVGISQWLTTADPLGNNRYIGGIDMGAYETQPQSVYVDSTAGNDINNGTGWGSAYKTLSKAFTMSTKGLVNTIHVSKGTYYPTGQQSGTDRDSAFAIIKGGMQLLGGYPSGGGTRDPLLNPVYLDGNINVGGSETDNSYHIMVIAGLAANEDSVIIDGFTFRNGVATGTATKIYNGIATNRDEGGAIFITNPNYGDKLRIRNCGFANNKSTVYGGAVSAFGSIGNAAYVRFDSCTFTGNQSGGGGGALSLYTASGRFNYCVFNGNKSGAGGGAMAFTTMNVNNVEIDRCRFISDTAIYGGALRIINGVNIRLTNNVFYRNISQSGGGGAISYYATGSDTIANNLFIQNRDLGPTSTGGAINISLGTQNYLVNNTFYQDSAGYGGAIAFDGGTSKMYNNVFYKNYARIIDPAVNDVKGSYTGSNNQMGTVNPLFANEADLIGADGIWSSADDGLRLGSGSPAINAGSNAAVPVSLTADIAGNIRIFNTTVDLGVFEFGSVPVPVKLLYFKAELVNDAGLLTWETASELNNRGFYIERSGNGKSDWEDLGFVASQGKEGNSTQFLHYRFYDYKLLLGDNYYRLRQTDDDGKINYSPIRRLHLENNPDEARLIIYPNPASHEGVVITQVLVRLFDIMGKEIDVPYTQDGEKITLDISMLENGIYTIVQQCAEMKSGKLVVAHD